jgi:dTDP-4-amino-4,6-dideoxygalactose transaminase
MLRIPFYRPSIGEDEVSEVVDTLRSGWLTTGPRTKQFEREFAAYLQRDHAVAVNSCTAALHLALEAIGLKAGQTLIVPTMTFAATAEVVRYLGARPILADCRVADFNLDVADAEQKIQGALATGQQVAAIMPVHYGGQIGDVSGVRALAKRYQLKVIEDAAHCCPAYYREVGRVTPCAPSNASGPGLGSGVPALPDHNTAVSPGSATPPSALRPPPATSNASEVRVEPHSSNAVASGQWSVVSGQATGAWLPVGHDADISCYSFYANKTITTGEGGMACTVSDDYADRMRIMSLHGISRDAWKRFTAEGSWYYEIIAPGFKYNLTDIAAAIGIHQLRKADRFHQRRTALAQLYRDALKEIEEIICPQVQPNRIHSWHLYVIRLKLNRLKIDRARFIAALQQRGIGTSVHWLPLHMHPYYRETYGYVPQDFPVAAALYPELVTLPLYPGLSENDVRYVCDSIKQIIAQNLRPSVALCAK